MSWYSWGSGGSGCLIHGDTLDYSRPKPISVNETTNSNSQSVNGPSSIVNNQSINQSQSVSSSIKSIACSGVHTLFINQSNQLFGCGENTHKQLVDDSSTSTQSINQSINQSVNQSITQSINQSINQSPSIVLQPISIPLGSPIVQVSCGWSHSAAIDQNGQLYEWGRDPTQRNAHAGRARSSKRSSSNITDQPKITNDTSDTLTEQSINQSSEQATSSVKSSFLRLISLSSPVTAVACGWRHSGAVSGGQLFTWGDNRAGQCGDGPTHIASPTEVVFSASLVSSNESTSQHSADLSHQSSSTRPSTTSFVAVACGWKHTLALTNDGHVFAFGSNVYGQCGSTEQTKSVAPHLVKFNQSADQPGTKTADQPITQTLNQSIKSVSCGWSHSACVDDDGRVWTFGRCDMGQLGRSSNQSTSSTNQSSHSTSFSDASRPTKLSCEPRLVDLRTPVISLACGSEHVTCVDARGEVWAWGWNEHGNIGASDDEECVRLPVCVTQCYDDNGELVPLEPCDQVVCGGAAVFIRSRNT